MATNTDWSKFQRRHLHTLLKVQCEIGSGKSPYLDNAIESITSEMETDDIERVMSVLRKSGSIQD